MLYRKTEFGDPDGTGQHRTAIMPLFCKLPAQEENECCY